MRNSYDAPMTADRPPYWSDGAACKDSDPDDFFPATYTGVGALTVADAKRVCNRCPVKNACLHWALERREPHGVWGGTAPHEREELARPARDPADALEASGGP